MFESRKLSLKAYRLLAFIKTLDHLPLILTPEQAADVREHREDFAWRNVTR